MTTKNMTPEGQKISVGIRASRIMREATRGKREVHSLFEFIGANLASIICLVVPIMMAISTGENVTVGGSDFVVNTAVWKLIGYEVLLIWGGLKICELVQAAEHANTFIGTVIGWFVSLFTKMFSGVLILFIVVGAMVGSNVTGIMYSGWQYKLANEIDTGAEEMALKNIARLEASLAWSIERNCLTESICQNGAADMWRRKIGVAEQELVAIRADVTAVETGGYEMISGMLARFWPNVTPESMVAWLNMMTTFLFGLGTLMSPYMLSTRYYAPLARFFARRKATQDMLAGTEDNAQLMVATPSIVNAVGRNLSFIKGTIARKIDRAPVEEKPRLPVASFAPPEVESAHPVAEIGDWGAPAVAHPGLDHTPVQDNAPQSAPFSTPVQPIVQQSVAPPVLTNAHPVQAPESGGVLLQKGFAQSADFDANTAVAHPIAQPDAPPVGVQKRAEVVPISADVVPSDSEVVARDRRVCDEVKKRHPDYDDLDDALVMKHIKAIGGEFNRAAGQGDRIGGRKAERIFTQLKGKTWVSPRPKTVRKRRTTRKS